MKKILLVIFVIFLFSGCSKNKEYEKMRAELDSIKNIGKPVKVDSLSSKDFTFYSNGTVDFFFNNGTTRATIDAGILRGRTTTPIATATTTGVAGTIIVGSDNYIYICTEKDTWVRVLGETW